MYLNRAGRFQSVVVVVLLLLTSLGITWLIANKGILVGPLTILGLGGIFLVGAILFNYRVGFYFLFWMGMFMFYLDRIYHVPVPLGIVYDALAALVFIALFINNKDKKDWTLFKNPVTIAFCIITAYQLLQFFNPNAVSHVAWLVTLRNNVSFLLYVVCFQLFSSVKEVNRFTVTWIVMASIVAFYGLYQEYVGLTDFEWRWMNASPDRLQLYMIWGKLRKFSMLSDPSSFGLFMAFSCLACIVLAMGPFKGPLKLLLGFIAFIMFLSMSYSGTRTAMAMVAVGIAFFICMTLQNRKTIIAAGALVFIGAVVLLGPFYGGTVNRIRSTFSPSEDASMAVRDNKRVRLQEYVLSHPIGGGLATTGANGVKYSPGHYLAGGWDPDSGYLLTALEMGWIGLIIFQVFFFIVVYRGIQNHFALDDPLLKTMNLTYIVPFFALSVAHFTQDAMFQKPVNIIVIVTYAVVMRVPSFRKKLFSVDLV
ncbi:MAG TPA: O-antigen ligase family protein [Chryseosolibacter sp.]